LAFTEAGKSSDGDNMRIIWTSFSHW